MANKSVIINVTIDEAIRTAYVTYSTGTEKTYPTDSLPKTVSKWLAENEAVEEEADPVEETVEEDKVKEDPGYSDAYERPTTLTEDELNWFHSVVEKAKAATGCTAEIIAYNHDRYKGTSNEALGCCITNDPENPIDGGYITIDTYFIHEMYDVEFNGGYNFSFDTLEHVIAHEIAHLTEWNHSEAHTALTEQLYQLIVAPEPVTNEEPVERDTQEYAEPSRLRQTAQVNSLPMDIVEAVVSGLLMATRLSLIALAYLLTGLVAAVNAGVAAYEYLSPRIDSLIEAAGVTYHETIRPACRAAAVWMAEAVWFILI